jgi:tryptophan-rich sensory protein
MGFAWNIIANRKKLTGLFTLQWVLNVSWTPVFFVNEQVVLGLVIISALTLLVGYFLLGYRSAMKAKSLLVLPYFVWLLIATSLNLYILLYN